MFAVEAEAEEEEERGGYKGRARWIVFVVGACRLGKRAVDENSGSPMVGPLYGLHFAVGVIMLMRLGGGNPPHKFFLHVLLGEQLLVCGNVTFDE